MLMKEIIIKLNGYINCKSDFYSVCDVFDNQEIHLFRKVNILNGSIDSGIFGASYLLSMCNQISKKDFQGEQIAFVDGKETSITDLAAQACFMSNCFRLFSTRRSVSYLVSNALKQHNSNRMVEEIRELFQIDKERFGKSIDATGHERYKAMAAVAYSHNKDIFCFPWFSKKRFECFNRNITNLLDILAALNKIVVLPLES